jgi:uncharacterized damage-inducible protein DinB
MNAIREHLVRLLDWQEAHVGFDKAVDGLPPDTRGARREGFEHSLWQLVEHIRIAQDDILDFCVNPRYEHTRVWPDDYWPKHVEPPDDAAWTASLAACTRSRGALQRLARDVPDLTATVPTGKAHHTYLRALLLAADHASYHIGQIVVVRRALGVWPQ